MDLKSRKIDPVRQEQGAWVDKIPEWGDLRLKVRGINNSDYQILQESLISERPRLDRLRGSIPKEEREHITATLLLDTVLLDWANVSEGGEPVPFSKEAARKYLFDPEYVEFRGAVAWAAGIVGAAGEASAKDALGNSSAASAGRSSGGRGHLRAATSTP